MWPLSIVLLLAAAPQQSSPDLGGAYVGKVPQIQTLRSPGLQTRRIQTQDSNSNVCFTIRSYNFRSQDGSAPALVGTTTCTPAIDFRQRQVSPKPGLYVPLKLELPDQPQ